jgi:flagellar basal-body rod modification protein FlgD
MSTSAVTSSTSSTSSPSTSARAGNSLGKDAFMKLLLAQLQNQDPTQPVDDTAFVAQLAQFSSLEQLQDISTQMSTLASAVTSSSQLSTASLIGRTVTFQSSSVDVTSGTAPAVGVQLPSTAKVTATISNASGQVVRTLAPGQLPAGTSSLGWDGKDASGSYVASGTYAVALTATGLDGSAVTAQALTQGTAQGVEYANGAAELLVGSQDVALTSIVGITP